MTIAGQTLGLVVVMALSASTLAAAQGAPVVPPVQQPAAGQAPQPAESQPATPPVETYSYDPAGRRDPFISLLSRGSDAPASKKGGGLGGLATGEVVLRGVLQSKGSYVALISGPDGKTYSAHVNDRLLDGVIRSVTSQSVVIMQEVNDPLSLVKQREVRKGLRTAEDVK